MEGNNFNSNTPQSNDLPQSGDAGYNTDNWNYNQSPNDNQFQGFNQSPAYNQNPGYNQNQGFGQNPMYNQNPVYNQNNGFNTQYNQFAVKQSGLGVASFIMSLVLAFSYFITLIAAVTIDENSYTSETGYAIVGIVAILLMVANVVALILGIVGAASKGRKIGLAIAGLIINTLLLLGIILIIVIGISNV